jgi:hypothetical protein
MLAQNKDILVHFSRRFQPFNPKAKVQIDFLINSGRTQDCSDLFELLNEALLMNKMVKAVDQLCTDFPSANHVELHHYILHHCHFNHLKSTFLAALVPAKSSLCKRGLMTNGKVGYFTICLDSAVMPNILKKK